MERPYFSEMLAERRRELGYSIRQASRILRLREDVLLAFEEGDFEQMPKSGYAQGMLSSYSRYLGLDANEVIEAYVEDYERYRHEMRRRGVAGYGSRSTRGGSTQIGAGKQPYVGSRGLLPTSGGPAGDMGTFATTRVRVRTDSYYDDDEDNETEGVEEFRYPQTRPYTGRTPTNTRRAYRGNQSRSNRDIETMDVRGYDDDLRLGRNAQPYEAASTREGRRSSRHISDSQRMRMRDRRRPPQRGGNSRRVPQKGQGNRRRSPVGFNNLGIIFVLGVVIALSLIIIFSVGTCVRQDTSSAKTVPVSEASSSSKADASSAKNNASSSSDSSSTNSQSSSSKDGSSSSSVPSDSNKDTSVAVSVADGAVTWLEVECDGKSDVAETVTGPWQKTYTVEDSITIQAGDTSSVSVVQNGKQVQFESMASGIGSIRIQGTKKSSGSKKNNGSSSSDSDSKSSTKNDESSDGSASTAKLGNASSKEGSESHTDTANSSGSQTGSNDDGSGYGSEYDYDSDYGYDEEDDYDYGY